MRGYLSFVLALLSLLVLLQLSQAQLSAQDFSLSKAITVQRAYSLQMNVKECMLASARQGAMEGFRHYDATHEVSLCKHCADHFCAPLSPVNGCDPMLCSRCFREDEARAEARQEALGRLSGLRSHLFDTDFDLSIGQVRLSAHLNHSEVSKNGYSLSHIRFDDDAGISFASRVLGIRGEAGIPGGCVVYAQGPSIC
jgi:hypothetical protein